MSTSFGGPSGTECISGTSTLRLARTTRDIATQFLLPSGLGRLHALFLDRFCAWSPTQCGVGDWCLCCNLSRTRGTTQLSWHRYLLEQSERSDRYKATWSRYAVFVDECDDA